ncbi:MAG: long-chain fatty acid--CoA ligase [Burkholderiales bacterium]|nr:long-chain fatty acid--CoA ligase [Burkholderiales bacterium]
MPSAPTLTLDTIPLAEAPTLPDLFDGRCARSPLGAAYRQFEPGWGWRTFNWADMRAQADRWMGALARERLKPGERVAVMLRNSVEWVCFDQAAQALGLVVVPLYPTDNPGNVAYILGDCGARVLLAGEAERWRALEPLRSQFPQLSLVVCAEGLDVRRGMAWPLAQWLALPPGDAVRHAAKPADLATIVYTSGTTGRPKGVMLSHRNILSNADAVLQMVKGYREDLFLSFLPLSHTMERTVGYYVPVMTGSCVAFARSVQDLADDLLAIRPTMLVSVPRIYERVYARLQAQLEAKGAPARALFDKAQEVGWHRFEAGQHRAGAPGTLEELAWPVLRHLVADRILERLGGRLRVAVSGGAPISARLAHCFIGLGLPMLQGYGLTEASPIVSCNRFEDNVPDSVGRPLPGVQVRLGERDELLVRGPNVMMGYWNDPLKTREAIDEAGWLHTGDIARMDAEGHLYIVGRIKEIVVTSTGEKVAPADLELAICEDPLFEQAMAVGEGRPCMGALAVLNADGWRTLAAELDVTEDASSLGDPIVRRAVLERMDARLGAFPTYARVRRVALTLEPWTIANGLATPTMKLRRRPLQERYAAEIERMYEERLQPA